VHFNECDEHEQRKRQKTERTKSLAECGLRDLLGEGAFRFVSARHYGKTGTATAIDSGAISILIPSSWFIDGLFDDRKVNKTVTWKNPAVGWRGFGPSQKRQYYC
jgi:hypothetical protein